MQISHHHLGEDFRVPGNLRGLLECGVQVSMDQDEPIYKGVEMSISYAGAVGTALWEEVMED
jgi:hypothetical protein